MARPRSKLGACSWIWTSSRSQLGNDDKAGLILHEIAYGEALARGHQDSAKARYLTMLIASGKAAELTPEEYRERLRTAEFDAFFGETKDEWLDFRWIYFDEVTLDFAAAKAACEERGWQLPDLKMLMYLDRGFNRSSIRGRMFPSPTEVRVWAQSGSMGGSIGTCNATYTEPFAQVQMSERGYGCGIAVERADEALPFVCVLDRR